RASLGRAQSLQRLRRIQAPQPRAPARSGGVALSAGVAADLCAQDARPVRRRPVPLRNRREPPDAGAVPALHPRAGHRPPARQAGGDFPEGDHDRGAGVTTGARAYVRTKREGVMAGLVPAIPISWHGAMPIGARGNESAFTRVFDALCPRATAEIVCGLPTLWATFVGPRPIKSILAHIAVQQFTY